MSIPLDHPLCISHLLVGLLYELLVLLVLEQISPQLGYLLLLYLFAIVGINEGFQKSS